MDGQIDRHMDRWTYRQTDRHMDRQTYGQTDMWTDRQTQTDRQMDRQTDTFIHDRGLGHFDEECGIISTLGVAVQGGDLRAFLGPHLDGTITTG